MPTIYRPGTTVNGEPARNVRVLASVALPWRAAEFGGETQFEKVKIALSNEDTESVVFEGRVNDPGGHAWNTSIGKARGLHTWRQEVHPQGFEDAKLETVLQWIADQCGGKIQLGTTGDHRRTYQLTRGTAHQQVLRALQAWQDASILVELDGEVLYVGPEEKCPQAVKHPLKLEYGKNIRKLEQVGPRHWKITCQLVPDLRLLNRLNIDHPLVSGTVKVIQLTHQTSDRIQTEMEVIPL